MDNEKKLPCTYAVARANVNDAPYLTAVNNCRDSDEVFRVIFNMPPPHRTSAVCYAGLYRTRQLVHAQDEFVSDVRRLLSIAPEWGEGRSEGPRQEAAQMFLAAGFCWLSDIPKELRSYRTCLAAIDGLVFCGENSEEDVLDLINAIPDETFREHKSDFMRRIRRFDLPIPYGIDNVVHGMDNNDAASPYL